MNDADADLSNKEKLSAILKGAFSGSPTPLKAIPKRNGKNRTAGKKSQRRLRRQRKNRAA
ncbi:MAG: hypothetical protein WCA56_02050 [Xanthobacteraceae bacterium]